MHSYNGTKEMTQSYNKINANIFYSLPMGILNVNNFEINLQKLDKSLDIDLNQLLIETDSPH